MAVARGPAEATAPIAVTREPASSPERGIRLPDTLLVRVGLIVAAALFLLPFYWMANSALKTIQESADFAQRMAQQAQRRGQEWLAKRFDEKQHLPR